MLKIRRKESKHSRRSKIRHRKALKRLGEQYYKSKPDFDPVKEKTLSQNLKLGLKYEEYIQSFISKNQHLLKKSQRYATLKLNHDFSIFNKSNLVLESLTKLLWHSKTYVIPPRIKYESHISFGAIHLLDHLCWEIGKKRKWNIQFDNLSEKDKAIISNLKTIESNEIENQYEYQINERIKINRSSNDAAPQQYKVRTTAITHMIEKAIQISKNDFDFSLPLRVHDAIKSSIGEQFDNIVLHSKESDFGVLCGFYDKDLNEVTLLIYNFGKTIAQTLLEKFITEVGKDRSSQADIMAEFIESVIESHTKKELLGLKSGFSIENALTLLAIQEGVSTEIENDKTRGHGITDFIEHCFALSADCKISLLSGRTCIKIDKKYFIKEELIMNRPRRILAFNKENDIFQKPDSDYVVNNTFTFNGVLIETIIPLGVLE